MMKDDHLQAVHDDDLVTLLESLGIYEDVINKQCTCICCGEVITLNNLGAIIPLNGKIAFSCDASLCLKTISEAGDNNDR